MFWNTFTIIVLLITIFILVGLCIFFIYDDVNTKNTMISPSQCPTVRGNYSVSPNTIGNSIASLCGASGTDVCTFNNITNLQECVDLCNANINICSVFSYSPFAINDGEGNITGIMNIMVASSGVSVSTNYDTYYLQTPGVLSSSSSSTSTAG